MTSLVLPLAGFGIAGWTTKFFWCFGRQALKSWCLASLRRSSLLGVMKVQIYCITRERSQMWSIPAHFCGSFQKGSLPWRTWACVLTYLLSLRQPSGSTLV